MMQDTAALASAATATVVGGRARWTERNERRGWHGEFTVAGGRPRHGDPLASLDSGTAKLACRSLSQACFWVSGDGGGPALGDEVRRWATVTRKVLQRGTRPPVGERTDTIIRNRLGPPAGEPKEILDAIVWSDDEWALSPEYLLHEVYEQPLWD